MTAVGRHARQVRSSARRRGVEAAFDVDGVRIVDRGLDEGWWGDDLQAVATRVGCFVGEAIRASLGAVWAWDPDRGLHLRVGERRVSPFEWVRRRMLGGPSLVEQVRDLVDRSGDGFPSAR